MEKHRIGRPITIVGQLIPHEHEYDMFGIGIMTENGPIIVESNSISKQLVDFLYQDVRVTGVLNGHRDGTEILLLDDYEVLG
jgi:hypothetical protein